MAIWKMQDAKVQLSALVKLSLSEGPQFITYRGSPSVVVLSQIEFDALILRDKKESTLK